MTNILDPTHQNTGAQTVPGVETPNVKLILMMKDTITSWLNIFNTNMSRIDTAVHNIELRTSINGEIPPEISEDIIKLNASNAELKELVKSHAQTIDLLTESVTNLQTQSATNTADIRTLLTNYTNIDTRLSTLQATVSDNSRRITKLETNAGG